MTDLLERRRLVSAAESVYSQVQYARTEAIKQSRDMFFVTGNQGTAWCLGVSDTAGCDCFQSDHEEEDACTVVAADAGERVLRTIIGTDFPSVGMASTTGGETQFNFVRGTVTDGTGAVTLTSPRGRQLRLGINLVGRVNACSLSGAFGGFPPC
jgi:type IV fimbrial biogenesis protein FimT